MSEKEEKVIKEVKTPKAKKPAVKKTSSKKAEETVKKVTESVVKPQVKKQRDMNEEIQVICITNTPLVYESKNQIGYSVEWGGFLEDAWIEYKELINMRNSQRAFFSQPWIICDWEVLKDLKVDQHYKNIIDLENLDSVFKKVPEELEETLTIVPEGIKKLILDRAFELRKEKKLDSLNIIEVIENTLKVDLTI